MAQENETDRMLLARIDERTEAIQGDIAAINEHLARQNEKLLDHETRLSTIEEKADNLEGQTTENSKNMTRLLIALVLAVSGLVAGILTGIAGLW